MRKFICLLLTLAILISFALPVFATEGSEQAQTDTPPAATTPPTAPPTTPPAPTECSHNWVEESTTNATCTVNGSTTSKCSSCGATQTVIIPATGHQLGDWIHVDESGHKRVCVCGHEETAAHTLSEKVNVVATCVSVGNSTFSCPCGYTFDKEYPATGVHTWTEWTATIETHSHSCSVCQKAESGAHVFTERVEVPATCKEVGVIADYCPTCEYIVYEEIPKLTTHTYDNSCDPECNVCGLTREIEHKYQSWRTKGATGHWYACSICGEKGDFEKHYPGPAATEEKDQICLVCGYIMTPKKNHQHDYAADWTTNEDGHWHACSGCEDQKDLKAHEYDDACDAECNICGYKTGNAHTFDGAWHSDEDGHWFVCSVCGEVAESKAHTAPAEATGEDDIYCVDCGYLMAAATAHVHDFGETWLKNDLSHWQECACGEKSASVAHAWDDGTEAEDGTVTYRCATCDAEKTEKAVAEKEQNGFPWWIVLLVLVILLIAAVVALVLVLKPKKKGRFS